MLQQLFALCLQLDRSCQEQLLLVLWTTVTQVHTSNGISIGSSVFVGFMHGYEQQTIRNTDHGSSVTIGPSCISCGATLQLLRLHADPIMCYKIDVIFADFFTFSPFTATIGHKYKLYVNHCKGAERIRVVCLQVLILRVYTDLNI